MYSITSMDIYLYRAIFVAGIFFPVLSILVLLCVYSKNVKESPKGKYFERFFKITLHSFFFFFTNVHDKIRNIFEKVNLRIFIYWLIDYMVFSSYRQFFGNITAARIFKCFLFDKLNKTFEKKIKELFIVMSYQRTQMGHKMISLQCENIKIQISNKFLFVKAEKNNCNGISNYVSLLFCRRNDAYGVMHIWYSSCWNAFFL